jgi:hypothetical protein
MTGNSDVGDGRRGRQQRSFIGRQANPRQKAFQGVPMSYTIKYVTVSLLAKASQDMRLEEDSEDMRQRR